MRLRTVIYLLLIVAFASFLRYFVPFWTPYLGLACGLSYIVGALNEQDRIKKNKTTSGVFNEN